jgi:hypothetical protein
MMSRNNDNTLVTRTTGAWYRRRLFILVLVGIIYFTRIFQSLEQFHLRGGMVFQFELLHDGPTTVTKETESSSVAPQNQTRNNEVHNNTAAENPTPPPKEDSGCWRKCPPDAKHRNILLLDHYQAAGKFWITTTTN